jgi:hypothetical protein
MGARLDLVNGKPAPIEVAHFLGSDLSTNLTESVSPD